MSNRSVKKTNVPVSIRNRMEKIYSYIKYCQRLEDAYRTKHEEVRVLNDYLKRIQHVLPENVSEKCPEVEDIITYIQGLPDVPDTDDLNETLRRMIDQQKVWREESTRNYNLINRKIERMTESRDVASVSGDKPTTKTVVQGANTRKLNKRKVSNNKTKRKPKKVTFNTIGLAPVTPTKSQQVNKMGRRNAIRNRKTKTLGKPK
jgi:hypothetical protein